jgi:serine acetyltransferase
MDKRKIRDLLKLASSIIFCWLYVPHFTCYILFSCKRLLVNSDIAAISHQVNITGMPTFMQLLYQLHTNRYFRHVFYYRMGPVFNLLFSWYRPGDKYFWIPFSTKVGKGLTYAHPYSTVLNAESIGDNFSCIQCVTIGKKNPGERRPRIGNNVTIGCHVAVIGNITIGNNVTIGAGSVVVKDVPDNAVIVGNPAKIIKYNDTK